MSSPAPAHPAPVLWLTGLPSAGKTTLSRLLRESLVASGVDCEVLDGDEVRRHLSSDLGFSQEDRRRNIERVAYIAALLSRQGTPVIVSLVSPYRAMRDAARALIPSFVEVHVRCAIETCEKRDVKGLYAKARRGEITGFTGVSDPYEEPLRPELTLDTDRAGAEQCRDAVLAYLSERECLAINPFLGDELLTRCFALAQKKHRGQRRVGGKPYMTHPAAVAVALSRCGCDRVTIAAGLLHDVLEDTNADLEDLEKAAGGEVAEIVCAVTDPDKTVGWSRRKDLYLQRLHAAGPRALQVAAADKAHNIRSLATGLCEAGAGFASGFSASLTDKIINYESILAILRTGAVPRPLLDEYRHALEQLRKVASDHGCIVA